MREIVTGLRAIGHGSIIGARPVRAIDLGGCQRATACAVFAELLALMMQQAHRGICAASSGETIYLIDAPAYGSNRRSARWARFSTGVCGAKVHVIYDPDADRPIYAAVSAANVNDITAAQAMPIEPGATYVFDLGYYDYGWWAKLDAGADAASSPGSNPTRRWPWRGAARCRPSSNILSDRIGHLPAAPGRTARNPMQDAGARGAVVELDTGKVLRILSNDLDAPAQEIADLYKRRWAIELFFRWVKQTLKIRRFPRHLRKRRPHPDRRRADRLSAAAPRSERAENDYKPARLRTTGSRQSHAPPEHR